jgi:hypothetical protein
MLARDNLPNIIKIEGSYFAYKIIAKIIDFNNSIVEVGDITIKIEDNIPSWANEGDFVEFTCDRLDLW